ncbi:hypothetical protein [Vibrio brasiliensis]|uniref:hypothetical protein n=1 Tax=Vibrio brasiliensis TaxID=170652 RepID=UPI001EFC594D|nr:hypothetical protein [Vibrio brasiliensis]MCG9727517.1 hypothetical protein [Vibrio brasiliensis]
MTLSKDHLYIVFCAFIVFCGGLLAGMISNVGKSPYELVISTISSVSTLGLLIAGIYSYMSWKKHINYGYLYESAKKMYLVMSECSTLYMSLYFKLQIINNNGADICEWERFVKAPEREADIQRLNSLIHSLYAEMQTLELISNKDDYQTCSVHVSTYTQLVMSLIKELERLRSVPNLQASDDKDKSSIGNLVFVRFKECEMDIKNILSSFINKH